MASPSGKRAVHALVWTVSCLVTSCSSAAPSGAASAAGEGGAGTGTRAGASGSAADGGKGAAPAAVGCLGDSLLAQLGKHHMLVGASMEDATAAMAPFDLRYLYLSGGLFDGAAPCASCSSGCATNNGAKSCANSAGGCAWWGCWQYDQDPPGAYIRDFTAKCTKAMPAQIPMVTYYQILQASGVKEGADEVTQAADDAAFMARYFADFRFVLQQLGSATAIVHIEPDFWGYAEQHGADPHAQHAAVASADPDDCQGKENSIAGMGQCLVAMVHKYSPNARVGLHASAWSTNIDVSGNTDQSLDVAGEALKTAKFLAACGESEADLVIVETSDRDSGYYLTVQKRNTSWDATNATLPNFHQHLAWVKALTEELNKPALYWQTPLGNAQQNNTPNHYKDDRVDYFFAHMDELAAAHAIGAAFGAGAGDQTTPESDGGNLVSKVNAYAGPSNAGATLCAP